MTHLLRTEEGDPGEITTVDGLLQGCPSAPVAFSMAMVTPEDDVYRTIADARVSPAAAHFSTYMGDLTLVTAPEAADKCFEALRGIP